MAPTDVDRLPSPQPASPARAIPAATRRLTPGLLVVLAAAGVAPLPSRAAAAVPSAGSSAADTVALHRATLDSARRAWRRPAVPIERDTQRKQVREEAIDERDRKARTLSDTGVRLSPEPGALTARVLATAARYVGAAYIMGGTSPRGFDCSGFVRYVFAANGMSLPRTAREQVTAGRPVLASLDSLREGDLLFFATRRGRNAHVAIYLGGGRIVHASAGAGRVRYADLTSPRGRWFAAHLSAVRRLIQSKNDGA